MFLPLARKVARRWFCYGGESFPENEGLPKAAWPGWQWWLKHNRQESALLRIDSVAFSSAAGR